MNEVGDYATDYHLKFFMDDTIGVGNKTVSEVGVIVALL
jgi:hypothetical protein